MRGVAYWTDGKAPRVFSYRNQYLYALDAKTGEPYRLRHGGRVDLSAGLDPRARGWRWSAAPLIVRDVVVVGSAMRRTSPRRWRARPATCAASTSAPAHCVGPGTRFPGRRARCRDVGKRIMGVHRRHQRLVADERRRGARVRLSARRARPATTTAATGSATTCSATALVCLDVTTGKRMWHFQTIHHDIWDYDNARCADSRRRHGRRAGAIKAVSQVTKQAFVYVFDRVTGKPVWPIEERPVPPSDSARRKSVAARSRFRRSRPAFDRRGSPRTI